MDKELLKRRVRKSLDTYDEAAIVQNEICSNLKEMLLATGVRRFETVFEIGCGTGLMTRKLLQSIAVEHIVLNDIVPEVESYLKTMLQGKPGTSWQFLPGDIEQVEFPENTDLVISSSALHWVKNIDAVFRKVHESLRPGGLFVFATYGRDNFIEVQRVTGHGLSYSTKDELIDKLLSGYEILDVREERLLHKFQNPLEVLRHMKLTGVNSTALKRWTKHGIEQFCHQYAALFEHEGMVPLTYHPLYFVLRRK